MSISSSKEIILKKIRKALTESTPLPFPQSEGNSFLYQPAQQDLEIQFAEHFSKLQGKFAFCLDIAELAAQLAALLEEKGWTHLFCNEPAIRQMLGTGIEEKMYNTTLADCDASITTCESLVARTGSIVLSAAGTSGPTVSVYAPVHIWIAFTGQLVYDIKDALQAIKEKYQEQIPSLISFATGPSRTADIEKTLVTGVHGPKEVYLFLVDRI
jgi:L-lactate dehydrogenase complex protein LldG